MRVEDRSSSPLYYRAAFASSLLPYPHVHQLTLRFASPCGRRGGLPRSGSVSPQGGGPACSPVALCLREEKGEALTPGHGPFWLKPLSVLGLVVLPTFSRGSRLLTLPFTLAPDRLDARSPPCSSRFTDHLSGWGYLVPGASYRPITRTARPGSVPVVEHWGMCRRILQNKYRHDFVSQAG